MVFYLPSPSLIYNRPTETSPRLTTILLSSFVLLSNCTENLRSPKRFYIFGETFNGICWLRWSSAHIQLKMLRHNDSEGHQTPSTNARHSESFALGEDFMSFTTVLTKHKAVACASVTVVTLHLIMSLHSYLHECLG